MTNQMNVSTRKGDPKVLEAIKNFRACLDDLWKVRFESRSDSIYQQQHDLSLTHGEGVSAEKFRWIEDRGVTINIWDKEQRIDWCFQAIQEAYAFKQEIDTCEVIKKNGAKHHLIKDVDQYIDKLYEDLDDLYDDLDYQAKLMLTEEEQEEEYKGRRVTPWERGEAIMYWLKAVAYKMGINDLVKWNSYVNKRRKIEEPEHMDYKLSFVHYVGCKIVLESQLSKKYPAGTKAQLRAKASYDKYMDMWVRYDLAARLDGTHSCQFDEELMDPDAAYYGRPGLMHSRYADMIDMKRISDDETVLQGYMLSYEAGNMNLPQGTENVSIATAILAMVRAKGNKAEAARMVNMPYSTFCYRVKQARKILEEKLDANEISSSEYNALRSKI